MDCSREECSNCFFSKKSAEEKKVYCQEDKSLERRLAGTWTWPLRSDDFICPRWEKKSGA